MKSPATVSPVQATYGYEPTQGSVPLPQESTGRIGCNATSTSTIGVRGYPRWCLTQLGRNHFTRAPNVSQ